MSTYGIEGVIEALTAAKEAQDALPGLRSQVSDLERRNETLREHTAALETTIMNLRDQLSAAQQKTVEVTRERDEAQFRELEASDKFTNAQAVLRKIVGEVSDFTSAVEPKTESSVEPQHEPVSAVSVPEGPTVNSTESQSPTAPAATTLESAFHSDDLAPIITGLNQPAPAQVPRYAGMAYWSKPDDVSWEEFITNGGEKAPWDHKTY